MCASKALSHNRGNVSAKIEVNHCGSVFVLRQNVGPVCSYTIHYYELIYLRPLCNIFSTGGAIRF